MKLKLGQDEWFDGESIYFHSCSLFIPCKEKPLEYLRNGIVKISISRYLDLQSKEITAKEIDEE